MLSYSAIKKLQAILVIDLIITVFATGMYFYILSLPESNVKPANYRIYGLVINPDEVYTGQTVSVSVKVENLINESRDYVVVLEINNEVQSNKKVQLEGRETETVEFNITKIDAGDYQIKIGDITGIFRVVPKGYHTLNVVCLSNVSTLISGVVFSINGQKFSTPFSKVLPEGTYTILMPEENETEFEIYRFMNWEDNSTSRTRAVNLFNKTTIIATYGQIQSCPWLYTWNGTSYTFVTEVSGSAYLGYFDRSRTPPAYNKPFPWDYIKLDKTQLQPKDDFYSMIMTQVTDEIIYFDAAWLFIVDHSPDVDVYSTKGTEFTDPSITGKIYTVNKNPLLPISCINDLGENCLSEVSKLDGIYASTHEFGKWQYFEVNLGNLSGAEEIKLIINGYNTWFPGWEKEWVKLLQNPNFITSKPSVYPYLQVKDGNGSWVQVPKSRDISEPSATPRTFIVELSGLFPTDNYTIRINTLTLMHIDYISVDIAPQQNIMLYRIDPILVNLHQRLRSLSTSTGNFTSYGDVTQLLDNVDDKFVIMRKGDELSLIFPNNIDSPLEGLERDFFLYCCMWYKKNGNRAYNFTVNPLPFYNMTAFPYSETEEYPFDYEHQKYLTEYNTRKIGGD
ncbi:MAG: hypothetical protein QW279_01930 [Candidatus Jordarchaeaceae archaeon]